MNSKKILKRISTAVLTIVTVIAGLNCSLLEVSAGVADIVVSNQSESGGLDTAVWSVFGENETKTDEGKMVFLAGSTEETRIITQSPFVVDRYYDELINMKATMMLKKVPQGQTFGIALGLNNSGSFYGEEESLLVYFENSGSLKAGVRVYEANGDISDVIPAKNIGVSLNQVMEVNITVTNDMLLTVSINGKQLCSQESPVNLEGNIGFVQSGSCEAVIEAVEIVAHKYDRPENTKIDEDFEDGGLNISCLTSRSTGGSGYVALEEYKGNHVFMFKDSINGYLSTKHMYSNFECTFDVPYIQYATEKTDEGNRMYSLGFGVAFGTESAGAYSKAVDAIFFENGNVKTTKSGQSKEIDYSKYGDVAANEGPSVKITVIDTIVTLFLKAKDATTYDEIFSYKVARDTPYGLIQIYAQERSNFAIDNLKIENKDADGNIIELDANYYVPSDMEDWEYEPMKQVYLETEEDNTSWIVMLVSAIVIAEVMLITSFVVVKKKKAKKAKLLEVQLDGK